jgi:hypothetical protein
MKRSVPAPPRDAASALAPSVLALVALLVLAGCGSSSKLVTSWGDPAFTTGPLRNIVVLVIREDPIRRRVWEDAFVQQLGERGVRATASYSLWPEGFPDTVTVRNTLRAGGYDGVLVTLETDAKAETYHVPGTTTWQPTGGYYDYYGNYRRAYEKVTTPGYTETTLIRHDRTDIWVAARPGEERGLLVWSGVIVTQDPPPPAEFSRSFAREIVEKAGEKGVF